MIASLRLKTKAALAASAISLVMAASPVMADSIFTPTSDGFAGSVRASGQKGAPIVAGTKATVSGEKLVPGQKINLLRGAKVLNGETPIVVDAEGKFTFEIEVDAEAVTGLHPLVVIAENPASAVVVDLKVSPVVPVQGAEKFDIASEKVARGLYQVGYSKKNHALFVAAAVGRPPVKESSLSKVDPETLKVVASVTPEAAPARREGQEGGLYAVYGVNIDDGTDTVWVTNTRQNTIAVYKQSDLSLVKQFEADTVDHPRDVVIDQLAGRAYVSSAFTGDIHVFDTKTLEKLETITITSAQRGGQFATMSLDIDTEHHKLATVSLNTPEAALVDLTSGKVTIVPLKGARKASGVAYDPVEDLLFVGSQETDNLLIVKSDGTIVADVETGANALSVTFEPKSRLAFVANRASGTVTVVDTKGTIVANIDGGTMPNQVMADGEGNVWAVNKSRGEEDPNGDRIWKIAPKAQ